MCGIYGFVSKYTSRDDLLSATRKLYDRGPDDKGCYFKSPIGLGHRRLSIIDIEGGEQPMHSADGDIVIVYNGEIYNFQELRQELESLGHHFKSRSDTEVILTSYQQWGIEKCLQRLEGMFAFALYDKREKKLFVTRDRFGEKPLYYIDQNDSFYFASEIKALRPYFDKSRFSKKAINLYFSLSYIPAPHTIYKDVYKLEPGTYIEISSSGVLEEKFYDLKSVVDQNQTKQIESYKEAKSELRQLLFASVEQRMISDVPLGTFLSGGLDSSIVSAIMAKLSNDPVKTFSIGFHEKDYDESKRSDLVAKHIGSDHRLFMLQQSDLLNVVDETLSYLDEPFGDSSIIPSMMVAKKAKEHVTVVLTGDCADELFGGYKKYLGKYYAEKYNRVPGFARSIVEALVKNLPHNRFTNHSLRKAKKAIKTSAMQPAERYADLTSLGFSEPEKNDLLKSEYENSVTADITSYFNEIPENDELDRTFYSDIKLVLEGDMLAKADRACMMNSLEARIPFLDSKIVDFSFHLPVEFKILGTNKKRILKDTFADLLPDETLTFSKKGFGLPLRIWFKDQLKNELQELIEPEFIKEQGIFNEEYLKRLLSEHIQSKENHSAKLWLIYVFQKWYKMQEK